MYSLKLELKLNNKERSLLAGCAGNAAIYLQLWVIDDNSVLGI